MSRPNAAEGQTPDWAPGLRCLLSSVRMSRRARPAFSSCGGDRVVRFGRAAWISTSGTASRILGVRSVTAAPRWGDTCIRTRVGMFVAMFQLGSVCVRMSLKVRPLLWR
jgi:hypothetical protein